MDRISEQALEFQKIREAVAKYASSEMGREAAHALAPLTNRILIEKELEFVRQFKMLIEEEGNFPISGLHDIRPFLAQSRAQGSILPALSLYQIAENLEIGRRIRTLLERVKNRFPEIHLLGRRLADVQFLERTLKSAISSEGTVLDSASPELRRIRRGIVHCEDSTRSTITKVLERLRKQKVLQEDIVTIRDGRFVIPVKDEFRHSVKGIVHQESATGATLFIEPMEAIELNNKVEELKSRELREIARILSELTSLVRERADIIHTNMEVLANLDIGHARALFAGAIGANSPALHDGMELRLDNARHPLLVMRAARQEMTVVPLNLAISSDCRTLLISGPNAGGKTVALKTVGILAWMVQSGLHVPVHPDSVFPVFENIYCDIGDQQSIESDLSTFSSHVDRLRHITGKSESHSLILIDEIGKGTSPEEGSALSMAVLEHLNRKDCITIATTHHNDLKLFAENREGMTNGSMAFDMERLVPLYEYRQGIPGSSYAFEIAQRLKFPPDILDRARSLMGESAALINEMLTEIEDKVHKHRTIADEVSREKSRLDGLVKLYNEKLEHADREAQEKVRRALEEADAVLASSNAAVERVIREIREGNAEKDVIREARKKFEEERVEIRKRIPRKKAEIKTPDEVQPGDEVRILNLNLTGIVLESPSPRKIRVQSGNKVLEIAPDSVTKISRKEERKLQSMDFYREPDVHDSIDVRGLDAFETERVLEDYLEEARSFGLGRVTIIHGKGKGVLRKTVSELLKNHEYVRSHRSGEWNEGADGVTIVELK